MSIEEKFIDYQARLKAAGVIAQPEDYFKAGYLYGAAENTKDAERYRYLRDRDLRTIHQGGIFAGLTPDNVVVNGDYLNRYIDAAMGKTK